MTVPNDHDEATLASPPEDPEASDTPAPETDPLDALRHEKDELQDRLLRTVAEFDNYRKRIERERRDHAHASMADVIQELLPIIDNLERALDAPAGSDPDVYRTGVELIHRQMADLLRQHGVTPIDATGTEFDPNVHQAVAHEVSAEHREGEVMEEFRTGYMIGERLLRASMVKVAKGE
ncbi:MAG: nucleotide exchange factor GrpE [Acidobacteria bacterium]|nr:nucleotide exchange factor GrpE [Acidobacteriota bacterium]